MMDFYEVFTRVIELLQREGRVSYRVLKRQFSLDDDFVEDLKEELIYSKRLAVDEDSRVLVWTGEAETLPVSTPTPAGSAPTPKQKRGPASYTPQHLAEKILTSRSALEGERKQVTVMFCDIANSTPLAERLGPERMHRLLNQFFELALEEVHRYEGTVNQFLGDGFMALFGAPIAHEDHARRAVLAAVSIRRRLHAEPTSLGHEDDVKVAIRLGLHTGLVIVGAIGDNLRMDYTAVGDTTNVASRLQNAAVPGQIVISETTHRLVEGYCTTRSLGDLSLKGKAEPIRAWDVLDVQKNRTRLEVEAESGLTPFVGRERELQILSDCFAHAQDGHGQSVFLVGEAGLGKSRLLLEFRRRLGTDATWLEGRALSFGRSIAFHPINDLLKRNFQIEENDVESTIIEKIMQGVLRFGEALRPTLPYVRYLLMVDPGDTSVQTMNPQLRRAEIFHALRRLLLRAAEVQPQVLVFEDLHWIDQATEAFLTFMADSIPNSRMLCLFTYRPTYTYPFGERTYYTRIALPTLSSDDTVQMTRAILATEQLPDALQALISQRAEGNPFFIEEVAESLREVGAIQQEGKRYVLTRPLEEIVVPGTIQDVLMARIDRLEEAPKKTLQLASVIGREFTRRLLERLTDIRERTEAYLQELKALELIYEKSLFPELAYMFKHALTCDVAYNSLLEQRRVEIHRLIGQAIEELYADRLTEHYEVLAYHFAHGEVWSKALAYFRKAAEKATQSFATWEAFDLYDQALEAVRHLGDAVDVQTSMAIHQGKAELYVVISDFERARVESECLLALARQVGDRVSEGDALIRIGHACLGMHHLDEAFAYTGQAIEVAEAADAKLALVTAYAQHGRAYIGIGQLNRTKEELDKALTISQSLGSGIHLAFPYALAGSSKNFQGELDEGTRFLSASLQIAREHSAIFQLLYSHLFYGINLTEKGDYDEAMAIFEEGIALAEKVGNEVLRQRLLNCFGWLHTECGGLDRAIELIQQSAESARRRGDVETIANAEINLSDIFLTKGDLSLAHELLDGVYRLVHDPAASDWMAWRYSMHLFTSLGELWLVRGDPARVQPFIEQCLEIATRTNSRKYIIKGQRLKGEIAFSHRQWDEAEGWLRHALQLAQSIGSPTQLWKTHLALGHLYSETRQPERARQAYRSAREVIDRIKSNLQHPELCASLEGSRLIQYVYDLSAE